MVKKQKVKSEFSLFQVLLQRGCVYQERHGWERPGWFSKQDVAEVRFIRVLFFGFRYICSRRNPV